MGNIKATNLKLGKGSFIHPTAVIGGLGGEAQSIEIGNHVYIGERVQILCNEFKIGDYSKIHHDTNIHGGKPCHIGHNAWIGQFSIIDSIGGVTIGDNCGIGAHSQLWSHIKYGDTLEGCRFLNSKQLVVGKDVWFVGHCIVSPITANDRSMAMVGSVVTKDMEYNHIYAGTPAQSVTDKVGYQFMEVPPIEKFNKLNSYLSSALQKNKNVKIVMTDEEVNFNDDLSYFSIQSRQYKKTGSDDEIAFMKFLLPEKAKFTPF